MALLCAACALAGCSRGGSSAGNDARKYLHSISYSYTPGDTSTRFFCDSFLLEDKLGGEAEAFLTCDGTVGIVRMGTGLYRVDESGLLMIHPAGVGRALLSLDGNVIVYTTATEVHIYDHRTGLVEDIKPDGISSVKSIVISPDCKTVGYTTASADGALTAWAHEAGQSRRLSDNAYLTGIADGAAWWYYVTAEGDVYYASASRQKRIGSSASSIFEFNRDLTEAAFDMNGVTYISVNGGSAKRIAAGKSLFPTAGACASAQGGDDCTAYVRDCGTLLNSVFYSYHTLKDDELNRGVYDLYYVNSSCKSEALARGAYQFSLQTENGKMLCLIDSDLYSMDADDPSTAKRLCTNVYAFLSSSDGSEIYCIGYDRKLYYLKDMGTPVFVLDGAVYMALTDEGKCLCIADYDKTGTLYFADGANEPKAVGRDVYIVESQPGICRYYSAPYDGGSDQKVYDLYVSSDGRAFELALKGVKLYQ